MGCIPKYPLAFFYYLKYYTCWNNLLDCKRNIQKSMTVGKYRFTESDYEDPALVGDYYDRYETAAANWVVKANGIQRDFDAFMADLQTCIDNAEQKMNEWDAKRKEVICT